MAKRKSMRRSFDGAPAQPTPQGKGKEKEHGTNQPVPKESGKGKEKGKKKGKEKGEEMNGKGKEKGKEKGKGGVRRRSSASKMHISQEQMDMLKEGADFTQVDEEGAC
jgi:hypothetical protein